MKQQQNELIQQDDLVPRGNGDEIDLLSLIQILGEEKWLLFGLPFLCACIAVVVSLYLPPMYAAKATFVVPDKQASATSAALDQLGSLGGLAGSLSKSSTEMYLAFMQSNTTDQDNRFYLYCKDGLVEKAIFLHKA